MKSNNILENISLEEFAHILKTSYLIPSMRILLDNIDEYFTILAHHNIKSAFDIHLQTKSKKKMEILSKDSGVPLEYMNLLRRMVGSYIPKARKLIEYPDFNKNLTDKLSSIGIKNSIKLDNYLQTHSDAYILSELNISTDYMKLIRSLIEVGRLRYVSPLFATVMVRCGYDSIEKISNADANEFHNAIISTNKEEKIYKGNIGDSDINFLIDDAKVYRERGSV